VEQVVHSKTELLDISCVGPQWSKRFLGCHLDLKAVHSCSLDYDHANANDSTSISKYFDFVKKTIKEYNIKSKLIFNMDEKGFLVGQI
jgi:hypothetical protein